MAPLIVCCEASMGHSSDPYTFRYIWGRYFLIQYITGTGPDKDKMYQVIQIMRNYSLTAKGANLLKVNGRTKSIMNI